MATITNPMTTSIPVSNGAPITVTTSLDTATGKYTTTASYPALNINFTGTPQQVTDQLNNLVNTGAVTDENTAYSIDSATNVIFSQQSNIGSLTNAPNQDSATPSVSTSTTTAETVSNTNATTTTTTTTTDTGGGSVTRKLNDDGTVTTTVNPSANSTVVETTTEQANPDIGPQPNPAVNTSVQQITPGIQTTQNNTPQLTGAADGDSNPQNDPALNQQSAAMVSNTGNNPAAAVGNATSPQSASAAPQSPSPSGAAGGQGAPGARIDNPLGSLASYNYVISLYTMTPSAHNAWIRSGRKDISALAGAQLGEASNGVYLLCQSGGINSGTSQRAPGFEYDYYIDNLKCTSLIAAKASGGDFFNVEFSFNITEPYGFSFIKNLRSAQSVLYQGSKTPASGTSSATATGPVANPLRGMYVLGIKFVGWNLDGTPSDGQSNFGAGVLDSTGSSSGLFQNFYDIQITSCTFKLDGKPVVYNITAVPLNVGAGLGSKRATLDTQLSIEGGTVDNALNGSSGVITQMNQMEANLKKNNKVDYVNTYKLTYLGPDVDLIKNATIVSPADVDKIKWANADVKKPSDSNAATAEKAPPNNTARTLSIAPGTNVSAAIGDIIKQSSYLTSALNTIYTSSPEPTKQGSPPAQTTANPKNIAWYNLSVETDNPRWDDKRGDWVYDINYVITTYDTPAIQTPYASSAAPYPGPYKRYDYWFTGQNKEVMGLTFQYDCSYFLGAMDASTDPNNSASKNNNAPVAPNKQPGGTTNSKIGPGMVAQNSYTSYLYDPAAYQNVNMKIMGDPDWIMTIAPPPAVNNAAEVYNKYYGPNGTSVNPNSGMCFVEVNFLEAVDYDNNLGYLTLNDQIYFGLGSPSSGPKPKGIIFQVLQVDSDFVNGKFTQTMTMNGTPWPNAGKESGADRPDPAQTTSNSAANSGPTPSDNNATSQATGFTSAKEQQNAAASDAQVKSEYQEYLANGKNLQALRANTPAPKTTPTGPQGKPVADGDASPPIVSNKLGSATGQNRTDYFSNTPAVSPITGSPVPSPLTRT